MTYEYDYLWTYTMHYDKPQNHMPADAKVIIIIYERIHFNRNRVVVVILICIYICMYWI